MAIVYCIYCRIFICLQEAFAEPARRGERDVTPAEGLGDPVPAIDARREARRKHSTATRAPLQGAIPMDVDTANRAPLQGALSVESLWSERERSRRKFDCNINIRAPLQGALSATRPRI